jgi:hypothetical protein
MGLFSAIGKGLKKVGRGALAVGTLGGSEAVIQGKNAIKRGKVNKEKNRVADINNQYTQIAQSEREMKNLLKQQPARMSAMNTAEANALKGEAYGTGPLAEYEAMRKQASLAKDQGSQRLQRGLSDELQNLSMNQAGETANAYADLAQSGGLSSGARERVAGSMGQQSMAARQGQRLQTQRAGEDLESQFQQGQQEIMGQESGTRRGLQNTYLGLQQGDIQGQNQYNQDQYGRKLDVMSGLAKAKQDVGLNAYRK